MPLDFETIGPSIALNIHNHPVAVVKPFDNRQKWERFSQLEMWDLVVRVLIVELLDGQMI